LKSKIGPSSSIENIEWGA